MVSRGVKCEMRHILTMDNSVMKWVIIKGRGVVKIVIVCYSSYTRGTFYCPEVENVLHYKIRIPIVKKSEKNVRIGEGYSYAEEVTEVPVSHLYDPPLS
jgi:hypothetical protein